MSQSTLKKNRSLGKAILKAKCPKCREGNLFPVALASFSELTKINNTCPNCGEDLMPEPDFYYGAMYISYGMSVALFLAVVVAINILFGEMAIWIYILSVVMLNVLLLPLMLRYSKVLYLYLLGKIHYEPDST